MSKSQVSELAKELDELVESWRLRPLDQGPYRYLSLDAMTQRCREAIESFRDKVVLPPEKFQELTEEAKSRAFSIAGLTRQDLLADAFAEVERGLSEGIAFGEFKRELADLFERRGWTGLAPWRAENIFRTNIQTAYQVGRYRQMTEPYTLKRRPYWMYDAVNDGRTRPTHAAMDGKVYRADSPVWNEWCPTATAAAAPS